MAVLRGQIPIYPRPVSPLEAEPVPFFLGSEIYEDASDDAVEFKAEGRAAKRRRIEKWGETYLRGEPIFIGSASLKGPLEGTGWKNPWNKRNVSQPAEGPELGARAPVQPEQADGRVSLPSTFSTAHTHSNGKRHAPRADQNMTDDVTDGVTSAQSRRPGDWLRTNDTVSQAPDSEASVSPSPAPRKHRDFVKSCSPPSALAGNALRGLAAYSNHGVSLEPIGDDTGQPKASVPSRNPQGPLHKSEKPLFAQSARETDVVVSETEGRAEYAIKQARRKVLDVPPSTRPPGSEDRQASDIEATKETAKPMANPPNRKAAATTPRTQVADAAISRDQILQLDDISVEALGKIHEQPRVKKGVRPPGGTLDDAISKNTKPAKLSGNTSRTSTNNLPPSAQVVPGQCLPPSLSLPSNSFLEEPSAQVRLEEISTVDISADLQTSVHLGEAAAKSPGRETSLPAAEKAATSRPPTVTKAAKTSTSSLPRPDRNTRQMPDVAKPPWSHTGAKPLFRSSPKQTVSDVTARKSNPNQISNGAPKPNKAKREKHASFAPDFRSSLSSSSNESQPSIKKALTVSKAMKQDLTSNSETKRQKDATGPSYFSKASLDMETSSSSGRRSMHHTSPNPDSGSLPSISSLLGRDTASPARSRWPTAPTNSSLVDANRATQESATPSSSQLADRTIASTAAAARDQLVTQTAAASSNNLLSLNLTVTSHSTSTKQDAQPQIALPVPISSTISTSMLTTTPRLNELTPAQVAAPGQEPAHSPARHAENHHDAIEEQFDLAGAIDDLGSYLGTWDVEKAASGLDAA